jgi:hypothetical protein
MNDCKYKVLGECDIRNSYQINSKGTLTSVLECEDCGRREVELAPSPDVPSHLKHLNKKAIDGLKYLFRGGFTS